MILRININFVCILLYIFVGTFQIDAMHELSCCDKITDRVIKLCEDPSLAHSHMYKLKRDLKTYTDIHKNNPSKFNSQNVAYIMWQISRFNSLYSMYSCQMSKKIIIEEIIDGNHKTDHFVEKWIWDKTTNGDYVAYPCEKNN